MGSGVVHPLFWGVTVVQLLSHVRLFTTSWAAACQASWSSTISQNLLKLMSIESTILGHRWGQKEILKVNALGKLVSLGPISKPGLYDQPQVTLLHGAAWEPTGSSSSKSLVCSMWPPCFFSSPPVLGAVLWLSDSRLKRAHSMSLAPVLWMCPWHPCPDDPSLPGDLALPRWAVLLQMI